MHLTLHIVWSGTRATHTATVTAERREEVFRRTFDDALLGEPVQREPDHADGAFDDLRQRAVGRHAREAKARLLQLFAILGVHLVAVAVAVLDLGRAVIDLRDA